MEIRNEYTSFNSKKYRDHTHHITKCLHEESSAQKVQAKATGAGKGQVNAKAAEFSRDGDVYHMGISGMGSKAEGAGKGKGLFRGFWDALGEEGETKEGAKSAVTILGESLLSGIFGAMSAIRQTFSRQVIEPARSLRERLRAASQGGRRYFAGEREAFGALTDGKASAGRNRRERGKIRLNQAQADAPKTQEDIPMKILVNSHLTDSYSKNGEYCQLGENLTYGKNRAGGKESGFGR